MAEPIQFDTVFDDESMHVGQVYAKALIAAAEKTGIDKVAEELHAVVFEVFETQPSLKAIFESPRVDIEQKVSMLDKIFAEKISGTTLNFLKVLAKRRRLSMLKDIENAVSRLRDSAAGRIRATLISAQPLTDQTLQSIMTSLSTKLDANVSVATKVDPSILGGLVIRIGDVVYDGSIDGQLKNLKRATVHKTEQAVREKFASLTSN